MKAPGIIALALVACAKPATKAAEVRYVARAATPCHVPTLPKPFDVAIRIVNNEYVMSRTNMLELYDYVLGMREWIRAARVCLPIAERPEAIPPMHTKEISTEMLK